MCLLSVVYRQITDCPILLLANREESPFRPTLPPRIVGGQKDQAAWMGGVDQQACGTWLGMNQTGMIVAIANRKMTREPTTARSRGLLIRDLLECESLGAALETAQRELHKQLYAGCNVLVLARESAIVFEAGDDFKEIRLQPGVHAVANESLNNPNDHRIHRTNTEVSLMIDQHESLAELIVAARGICRLHQDGTLPGICRHDNDEPPGQPTVSSTIIALTEDQANTQYHYAAGRPCTTPYSDYSPVAHELLSKPSHHFRYRTIPHRIHLKGPWHFQWLSDSQNSISKPHDVAFAVSGRVKMPTSWQACFGNRSGRIRFRRRFQQPTNLGPHERVFLAFDGVGGTAIVTLNGTIVGSIADSNTPANFDVTNMLKPSNELVAEVEFRSKPADNRPGGLWGDVAIEILTIPA